MGKKALRGARTLGLSLHSHGSASIVILLSSLLPPASTRSTLGRFLLRARRDATARPEGPADRKLADHTTI